MRFPWLPAAGAVAACFAGAAALAEERAPEGTSRAEVVGVEAVDEQGSTRVTLRAGGSEKPRLVDIFVGPAEGAAIARALSGRKAPRPMTHDLLAEVMKELGGRIARLTISSLEGGVFIGELTVVSGDETHAIDTRPSDGMALALAAGAPVYVADGVVEQAGRAEPEKKAEEKEPRRPRPFGPPRDLI